MQQQNAEFCLFDKLHEVKHQYLHLKAGGVVLNVLVHVLLFLKGHSGLVQPEHKKHDDSRSNWVQNTVHWFSAETYYYDRN